MTRVPASLTRAERRALHNATAKGGAQVRPPFHRCGRREIPGQVALALVQRDLLRVGPTGIALITRAGTAKLARPIPEDPPVFLRARYGLTTRPDLAARGEPEITDPATLDAHWAEQSLRRVMAAADARRDARSMSDRTRGRASR